MDILPPRSSGGVRPASQTPIKTVPSPVSSLPPIESPPEPKKGSGRFRNAISTIGLFVSAFLIAIILNTFVVQSYQVDGQSMEKTLQNGDRLIVNKIPRTIARIDGHQYVPNRGDIIILNISNLPGFIGSKQLIKRVVGLPGEHVVVKDGKITVFNKEHPEGFNPDTNSGYKLDSTTTTGNADRLLQNNELFVAGDNRDNSEDSRYFGPITTDQVVAKLVARILPLNKAQAF